MDWKVVKSSQINKLLYLQPISTLLIEFNNNKVYSYTPVPEHIYKEVLKSDSVGKAFNKYIKKNSFIINKQVDNDEVKEFRQQARETIKYQREQAIKNMQDDEKDRLHKGDSKSSTP